MELCGYLRFQSGESTVLQEVSGVGDLVESELELTLLVLILN